MNKQFIIFYLLFLPLTLLYANTEKDTTSYVIKGRLIEAVQEQKMAYANVRLLQPDSTFIAGVRTNAEGAFHLTASKEGSYLLAIDNIGYESIFHDIHLSQELQVADLGILVLQPSATMLKDMEVVAAQQQITMRGDTLVYNADAFRVPPGATLGTLLSRLPGVTIEDGVIKFHGEVVNKLLINGKEFFSGDMSIALENLPTEIVESIEAYETRTDEDKQSHTDSGERLKVLNVTIKKEYKGTWLGNTDLAAGTGDHYSTRAFLTRFTDRLSLSAFAQINNLNDQSEASPNGGWRSNDWSMGLNTFRKMGINAAWDNGKKEWTPGYLGISGNINASHNNYNMEQETVGETFYPGASHNYSNSVNGHTDRWNNVVINNKISWEIDSLTNFYGWFHYGHTDNLKQGYGRSATFSEDPYKVPGVIDPLISLFLDSQPNDSLQAIAINSSNSRTQGFNNTNSFSTNMHLGRRLSRKGHRINLRYYFDTYKSNGNNYSLSDIRYYNPDAEKPQDIINQYSVSPNSNSETSIQLDYEHVLSKSQRLRAAYTHGFAHSVNDYTLHQLDSLENWRNLSHPFGTLPSADSLALAVNWRNSSYDTRDMDRNEVFMQYRIVNKNNINASFFMSLNNIRTKMNYLRESLDTLVTETRFSPRIQAYTEYKFKKNGYLRFNYNGSRSFPSMTQMLDITDDRNPLNIVKGNPDLRPSWTNNFYLNFQKEYGEKRKVTLWANGSYWFRDTEVSNTETYDPVTGGRIIKPENVDGSWGTNLNAGTNIPLDEKKRWNFAPSFSIYYRENVGYFTSAEDNISLLNRQTNFGFTPYLNLNYRVDGLYIATSNSYFIGPERNSLQPAANQTARILHTGVNAQYEFKWGTTLSSDFYLYSCRGFTSPTMNNDQWLWNASISQSFLKKKNLVVVVEARDILGSKRSEWANSNVYSRYTNSSNTFRDMSYVMMHLIYRFSVGKKAQ